MQIKALLIVLTILCGGISSAPAAAKDLVLEASSPWVMDYAADSCALRRTFGDELHQAVLELRRFAPQSMVLATVTTNALNTTREDFEYRFDPQTEWRDGDGAYVHFDNNQAGVIFRTSLAANGPPSDSPDSDGKAGTDDRYNSSEAAAAITGISVRGAFGRNLVLHTGSLVAPWEAMAKCLDELVTHWGIDAEAQKTLMRRAYPINLPSTAKMIAYPPKMLARLMPGIVNVRLAIDERGAVTGCFIQMPLSDPAFEKTSCGDLESSLVFEPAIDKDGKPLRSYWVVSIRFKIGY